MATIEEIEDLSVEIINELIGDGDEPVAPKAEEAAPVGVPTSPARAAADDAAALAIPGSRNIAEESDDEDDDDFDETILERIVALTEMFPDSVQVATSKLVYGSLSTIKGLYSFGRASTWILFSTSAILFAPIIFEVERAQMEEMQKQQQRQILLGPGAAMSGGGGPGLVPSSGMAPPPPR